MLTKMTPRDLEWGDLMSIENFRGAVKAGMFRNYDGFGKLATETEESDIEIYPSMFLSMEVPDWATHVMWYNK